MSEQKTTDAQLKIIDGQLFGSIMYVGVLVIGIILILNERQNTVKEEGFMTATESQNLALFNKLLILILVIYFFYLTYKSYELAVNTEQETRYLELQIISSILTIITAIIGYYVVFENYQSTTFRISEIDNPEV